MFPPFRHEGINIESKAIADADFPACPTILDVHFPVRLVVQLMDEPTPVNEIPMIAPAVMAIFLEIFLVAALKFFVR